MNTAMTKHLWIGLLGRGRGQQAGGAVASLSVQNSSQAQLSDTANTFPPPGLTGHPPPPHPQVEKLTPASEHPGDPQESATSRPGHGLMTRTAMSSQLFPYSTAGIARSRGAGHWANPGKLINEAPSPGWVLATRNRPLDSQRSGCWRLTPAGGPENETCSGPQHSSVCSRSARAASRVTRARRRPLGLGRLSGFKSLNEKLGGRQVLKDLISTHRIFCFCEFISFKG